MDLRELQAARTAALTDAREAADADPDTFRAAEERVREIDDKIERHTRLAEMERTAPAGRTTAGPDEWAESRALLRGETRAMSTAAGEDGGYAMPEQIDRTIQMQLRDISPMRRVATVVNTTTPEYRRLINRLGTGTAWASEGSPRAETATPVLGFARPPFGELYAYPAVTQHALEDLSFNVESFIREDVAAEMAFAEGEAFLNGDGINKPQGLLTVESTTDADDARQFDRVQHIEGTSTTTQVRSDTIFDLVTALRPAYRQGPGVAFMANSTTMGQIRKLKDGDGNYLWREGLAETMPSTLLGYPMVEAEAMPDPAPGAVSLMFANFRRGYLIADRRGTRMIRDEITEPGLVKFYISRRLGGCILDPNAVKFARHPETDA